MKNSTKNAERQRRLRQRRKEAGLVDYRRAVTPEQAKALDSFLKDISDVNKKFTTNHFPDAGKMIDVTTGEGCGCRITDDEKFGTLIYTCDKHDSSLKKRSPCF